MGPMTLRAKSNPRSGPASLRYGRCRAVLWLAFGATGILGCSSPDFGQDKRDFAAMGRGYSIDADLDRDFRMAQLARPQLAERDFLADGPAQDAWRSDFAAKFGAETDWIAPQRLLDDLAQEDLRGPQAWKARSLAYEASGSARDAYLLGRLEIGERSRALLERAQQLDPQLSWGRHGYAWTQTRLGNPDRGVSLGARAIDLAASLAETIYFERAVATGEVAAGQRSKAEQRLLSLSKHPDLLPAERAELQAWTLGSRLRNVSLTMDDLVTGGSGTSNVTYLLALALLRDGSDLSGLALEQLARDVAGASFVGRTGAERLRAVLGEIEERRDSRDLAKQLRHELSLRELGGVISSLGNGKRPLDQEQLQAAIALVGGDVQPWLQTWWKRLPVFLQSAYASAPSTGLATAPASGALAPEMFQPERGKVHVNPELARLLSNQGLSGRLASNLRVLVADSLLESGWFAVAEAVLLGAAPDDEGVAELRSRATKSRSFLTELRYLSDEAIAEDSEFSLQDVLVQLDELARTYDLVGREDLPLGESMRLHYGPFAEVVHPGPRYLGQGTKPVGTQAGKPWAHGDLRCSTWKSRYRRSARSWVGVDRRPAPWCAL